MQAGFYHLNVSTFSRTGNQSGAAKHSYICRTGNYVKRQDDLVTTGSGNMPSWAAQDPAVFWSLADEFERANGRLGKEIEFALPRQLSTDQQRELVEAFAQHVCGKAQPYTFAIHRNTDPNKQDNPHCHLIFSERINDYVDRPAKNFFKRSNKKHPEKGGAKKSTKFKPKNWLEQVRKDWSEMANLALKRADLDVRIDHRSYADRGIMRAPQQHLGASATAELRRTGTHPKFEHNCKIEQLNNEHGLVETFVFNEQEDCSREIEEVEAMQQQLIDAERDYEDRYVDAILLQHQNSGATTLKNIETESEKLAAVYNSEAETKKAELLSQISEYQTARDCELEVAGMEVQALENELEAVVTENERVCFDTLFAEAEARLFADLDRQFNDVKTEIERECSDAILYLDRHHAEIERRDAIENDLHNEYMSNARYDDYEVIKMYRGFYSDPGSFLDESLVDAFQKMSKADQEVEIYAGFIAREVGDERAHRIDVVRAALGLKSSLPALSDMIMSPCCKAAADPFDQSFKVEMFDRVMEREAKISAYFDEQERIQREQAEQRQSGRSQPKLDGNKGLSM